MKAAAASISMAQKLWHDGGRLKPQSLKGRD
jgi:hypothetical protein